MTTKNQLFKEALQNGDIKIVKEFLSLECRSLIVDDLIDNKTLMHQACQTGNVELVSMLIENGCQVEYEDEKKMRPIHYATIKGSVDIVRILIENNCNIECENIWKLRPTHYAFDFGHLDIFKLLMENRCNLEAENHEKKRPIHYACEKGYIDIVRQLIESKCDIECEDRMKKKPIHYACGDGHSVIVKLFIDRKCSFECEDGLKMRPIHYACKNGHFDTVRILIENRCNIECSDVEEWKPIHYACENGYNDIVQLLIDNGCNIECEDYEKKRPIHVACDRGHIDLVRILIKNKCNIECEDDEKKRPIHYACENGHIDVIRLLIENKCDIECQDLEHKRPIHYACENWHVEAVQILILNKCNIECGDHNGKTPTHYVCERGCNDILKILIDNQSNIECQDNSEWKPIHFSCENGHISVLRTLMDNKCNIECQDQEEKKPIHLACANGHTDIVQLLIENKCEIECEDQYSRRPITYACERRHIDIAKTLIMNKCNIDCIDFEKKRPIHYACQKGYIDIVKILINNGCCIEREDDLSHPLQIARENNQQLCVDFLEEFTRIKTGLKSNLIDPFELNKKIDLSVLESVIKSLERDEQFLMIKEHILAWSIKTKKSDIFDMFCLAEVISDRNKIMNSSFLEMAAENGCKEFINGILKKTVYNEQIWDRARTVAKNNGHEDLADMITDREFIIMSRLKRNFTLLHTAVCDNDADMVKYLLDEKIVDANINHEVFGTALALAISLCHRKCIAVLEQFNVDTNTQNKYNQTPLHEVIASGVYEECKYLLETCSDINREGFNNLTALHCAVIEGCNDLCEKMIEYGADCMKYANLPCAVGKEVSVTNPLSSMSSTENSLTLCMKINRTLYPCFLQQLDSVKAGCSDGANNSLLHLAAASLRPEICKTLLEYGVSTEIVNERGNTALLELFLNVDRDTVDKDIREIINVMGVLISSGADVNAKTKGGLTVLQCASSISDERLMVALASRAPDNIYLTEIDFMMIFVNKWYQYGVEMVKLIKKDILSPFISEEVIKSVDIAQSELIKCLFDKANEKVQQSVTEDILLNAARGGEDNVFDYLLEYQIIEPKMFDNGENLLTNLLKDGKTGFIWKLCNSNKFHIYANLRNRNNQLPLQVSVEMEAMDISNILAVYTNDVNNKDKNGETVLMQLMSKISSCNDGNTEQNILKTIQSIIEEGGNIYMTNNRNIKVIDLCFNQPIRAKISSFDQKHRKISNCNNCSMKKIGCVFQCGHGFCETCSERLVKCAVCQCEKRNYIKINFSK